jgi:hypothetical protein
MLQTDFGQVKKQNIKAKDKVSGWTPYLQLMLRYLGGYVNNRLKVVPGESDREAARDTLGSGGPAISGRFPVSA